MEYIFSCLLLLLSASVSNALALDTVRVDDLKRVNLSYGSLTSGARPMAQLSCVKDCDDGHKVRDVSCVSVGSAVKQVHNFPPVDWNCSSTSMLTISRIIVVVRMSCECQDLCQENLLLKDSCSLTYQLEDKLVKDKNAVRILLSKWDISENMALLTLAGTAILIFCLCHCCSAADEAHPVPKPGTSSLLNQPPPLPALKPAVPTSGTPSPVQDPPSYTAVPVATTVVSVPVVPPRTKYPDGEHVKRWCFN